MTIWLMLIVLVPLIVLVELLVAVIATRDGFGAVEGAAYKPEELTVPTVELPPATPPALQVTPVLVKF